MAQSLIKMPILEMVVNNAVTHTFELAIGANLIGRNSAAEICLKDASVSFSHATVVVDESEDFPEHYDVYINDLESTNGTVVNGDKVSIKKLSHGDVIRIGSVEFIFSDASAEKYTETAHIIES